MSSPSNDCVFLGAFFFSELFSVAHPSPKKLRKILVVAFSLLELLIAMALLSLLVVLAATMINSIQIVWRSSSARSEQYRAASQALETIDARLSQATLNPYLIVATDSFGLPVRYERQSDLRFLCAPASLLISNAQNGGAIFFQSPTGYFTNASKRLDTALNTWGYYVEYGSDAMYAPDFLSSAGVAPKNRYRLIEFLDPSDSLKIFQETSGKPGYTNHGWFTIPLGTQAYRRVLAENIVAFIVLPRLSRVEDASGVALAPQFIYDSTGSNVSPKLNPRHQLPPIVDVALVAIDEASAQRVSWGSTPPDFGEAALFQTPADMEKDLETLRSNLAAKGLSARVFRISVPIAAARWSTEQSN